MKPGLTIKDFERAAKELDCEVAAIRAVDAIESRGKGFYDNTKEPTILFERHIFWRETKGKFGVSDISNPSPGGYGSSSGAYQHSKLKKAASLDREAALKSCSWGRFQIMGFNWRLAGENSLQSFINSMYGSEAEQLDCFVSFLKNTGLVVHLRNRDWARFAKGYNGAGYKKNRYDVKLKEAYDRFK